MYRKMLHCNLLQASTKPEKITCLKPCMLNRVKVDHQLAASQKFVCVVCASLLSFSTSCPPLFAAVVENVRSKCDSRSGLYSSDFPFQISAEFQCSAKVKGQVLVFLPAHGDQRSRLPRCLTMATYRTKQQKVTSSTVNMQTAWQKKETIDIVQFCLWGTAPVGAAGWSTQE